MRISEFPMIARIKTPLRGIEAAAYGFEKRFQHCEGPAEMRDNAKTLAAEFCRALAELVEECGGDRTYFPGVEDGLFDAIDDGFEQAIRDYDDEQEALADPTEREMSRADRVYDATRV